jgi:signal transduction histidine kinase
MHRPVEWASRGQRAPLRLLLVEDDEAFTAYVRLALTAAPDAVELETAGDLATALEAVRAREPEGILLDLSLPDSQGLATLRVVLDAAPNAAVVILTGAADVRVAPDALRLGAQDWLVKGDIEPEVLGRALRYAVERKRLVRGLVRAQKLEVAGRLATGVAHEFNNVLTAILGSAQLVEDAPDDEARRGALDLLRRAARQGAALSQQLLSLARNPPNNATLVSTAMLLSHALPLVQAIVPATIELQVGPVADIDVQIDPGQFDQMLLNLVFNAKDAMPDGGTLRISVQEAPGGPPSPASLAGRPFAVFRVSDTGPGMENAVLAHLFEPFFTTKGARGTGLGLAVSAEIVERFGGVIHVDSRVGVGTSFAVWLPAVASGTMAEEGLS